MHIWVQIIFLILILVILDAISAYCLNKTRTNKYYLILGVFIYIIIALLFAYTLTMDSKKLGIINAIWQCLNITLIFLVSFFIFGEKFTPVQYFAIFLAIIATILMIVPEFQKHKE
jgi:multidrug transporter EmrE-like cation transporter